MSGSPSSLAPFSFNWVGGDIHGLSALAGALYGFSVRSERPASVLSGTVNRLVGDSGEPNYKGSAADNFKREFDRDMNDVRWLSSRASSMGDIVDRLAVRLAQLEASLESFVEQGVRAKYISLDSSGKIRIPGGIAQPGAAKFMRLLAERHTQILAAAKAARKTAADRLEAEYKLLAGGLRNYRDHRGNLLSDNEIAALGSSLNGLDASFKSLTPQEHGSWVHAAAGAGVGGAIGGGIGAVVGGTLGIFGGPFAEVTVPGGMAAGNAIGNGIGSVVGGVIGWAW